MDNITIRAYRSTDCQELIQLFRDTVHHINLGDYTKEQVAVWAPVKLDTRAWDNTLTNHYTIVAQEHGCIVGFGDVDEDGYFDHLYVHKCYQRQGIATKIADEIERYTIQIKTEQLTTHASITALPFFLQRGYVIVQQQSVSRADQLLTNFLMKKDL